MRGRWVVGLVVAFALACTGEPEEAAPVAPPVVEAPAESAPAIASPAEVAAVYPYYQTTEYDRAALKAMSLQELAMRRNAIFARVGQPFRKAWLDQHFRAQSWYHPQAMAALAQVPEIDRKNAATIADVEASFTKEELRTRKLAALAGETPVASVGDEMLDWSIEVRLLSAALGDYQGDESIAVEDRNPLEDPTVLDRPVSEAQLADLSRRDLRILRNTIFARHGRPFKSEILQQYFAQKEWYKVDKSYKDTDLTDVDKANIATIVKVEESLGGMLTDADHKQLDDQEMMSGA
jgi:hypothetical protein